MQGSVPYVVLGVAGAVVGCVSHGGVSICMTYGRNSWSKRTIYGRVKDDTLKGI
jgi:hypothetical protein